MIFKGYLFGIGYAFLCLILSLIIYKIGVPKNITRKVVHILVGFEWVILYNYLGGGIHFLAVCVFFLALLTLAYKKSLMPMISSDSDNAPGTVYYAIAMTGVSLVGCFIPEVMIPFGIAIMCTSLGDGFAGVVGQSVKRCNPKIYANKSLLGSLANFVMSFGSCAVINYVYDMGLSLSDFIWVALLSVILELVTGKGLDNITITWGVTAFIFGLLYWDSIYLYVAPIVLSALVIAFAIRKKALTYGGVVMAITLDFVISAFLGNFGFVLLVSFFLGALLIDKFKKRIKMQGRVEEGEKGECRDYMQVIANGLIAGVTAILAFATASPVYVVAFAASLGEALADTASSGIGIASKSTYDIFRFRKCESGISGGMSLIGTAAAFVASYAMAMIGFAFGIFGIKELAVVTAASFLGSIFDSLLGSLLQAKFRCQSCGKITEKHIHCGEPTEHFAGLLAVDNDTVNLLSGLFAAILGGLLYVLI